MALIQKAFSDIITFSRSSNATRIGPNGLVQYAPHNLLLQSQTFDNASWTKTRSSVTANSLAAPDGTVTAEKLIEDTTASDTHTISQGSITVANSTVYTISFFAKAGERSWVACQAASAWTGGQSVYFNLSGSGSVGTLVGAGIATITLVGNGWYRCTFTPPATTSTSAQIILYLANANNGAVYTGDGTSGIYLWGAQLAVGPYPLDYTPTTSAAVYGPRFDYDPTTLAARGLLVEEQRTNLCPYSEQLGTGSWNTAAVTFANNAGTAPTGEITADKISPASSGTFRFVYYDSLGSTLSSSTVYTISMFLKASGKNWGYLRYEDKSNASAYVYFNLSAGVVGSTTGTLSVTSKIENYGNGWYRCSVTGNSGTGAGGLNPILFGVADADGSTSVTVSGTDGILAWGAQLEAGSFATSYIPTLASTVTRSADVASVNTLSPWYNATEGTLYAEWTPNGLTGSRAVSSINDGTSSELIEIRQDITDGNFLIVDSTTQANIGLGALTAGSTAKVAGAFKLNDIAAVLNGGTVQTDTAATLPTVTALELGARGGVYLSGHLRRIAFYPRRLTNSEIDALTS